MSIILCSIHNRLRQMTLTLKDKCEAKLNLTWLNTFYLLMIRVPSAVLISCCTKPLSKVALLTQNSQADNEQEKFVGKKFITGKLDPLEQGGGVVAELVGGVGNCCGRPTCLGSYMGRRLNTIWLKLRILQLIIKRKNLFMCVKIKFICHVCWSAILF